jgi:hypothetical protein
VQEVHFGVEEVFVNKQVEYRISTIVLIG